MGLELAPEKTLCKKVIKKHCYFAKKRRLFKITPGMQSSPTPLKEGAREKEDALVRKFYSKVIQRQGSWLEHFGVNK